MTDLPILFSGPMVRALLAGTKTQTRRAVGLPTIELMPIGNGTLWHVHNRGGGVVNVLTENIGKVAADYYRIQPGDRLYVRERWVPLAPGGDMAPIADATYSMTVDGAHQHRDGRYREGLGEGQYAAGAFDRFKWRPGIHMPKWASRITLHVTEVRVQRLQEISEEDARAEGARLHAAANELSNGGWTHDEWYVFETAKLSYTNLWNAINGPGSWEANPWVAATTFEVERCNIAQARAA